MKLTDEQIEKLIEDFNDADGIDLVVFARAIEAAAAAPVIADTAGTKPVGYLSAAALAQLAQGNRSRIESAPNMLATTPVFLASPAIDAAPADSPSIAGDKRVRPRIDEIGLTPQCPAMAMTKQELEALPDWVKNAIPPEAP